MLFYKFSSQEERRRHGGSCFLELQFCRLPAGTPVRQLVAVDSIDHWRLDSLYADDENLFCREYDAIFDRGTYNNLKTGPVDPYGINYYGPEQIDLLLERIQQTRPADHKALLTWLREAREYNGFYVLGL